MSGLGDGEATLDDKIVYAYEALESARRVLDAAGGPDDVDGAVTPPIERLLEGFVQVMASGGEAPSALDALLPGLKEANRLVQSPKSAPGPVRLRSLARFVRDMGEVSETLGVLEQDPTEFLVARRERLARARGLDPARVDELVAARVSARAARDFARADEVRAELDALGVHVLDDPSGSSWRL